MIYTVVRLDGKEEHNLALDEVKALFFRRQINQDSLISSLERPNWQMLKRAFDLSLWLPESAQASPSCGQSTGPATPAAQQFQAPKPVPAPGYTQNNQSETFYQADNLPAADKLPGVRSNYAPTNVRHVAASPGLSTAYIRPGYRAASVFIAINLLIFVGMMMVGTVGLSESPEAVGTAVGRSLIPIVIDLFLAGRLWRGTNADVLRRWVLLRTYLGFVVGLVLPFAAKSPGEVVIGVAFAALGVLYLIAIGLVLHGRNEPSTGRIYAGVGAFAMFALIGCGVVGLAAFGRALPALAKMDLNGSQVEKYRIEGSDFRDQTTGAAVTLPEGWVMLSTTNPIVNSPSARMIATDKRGERLTMLEIVPVPAEVDMKRQAPSVVLDRLCDGVVSEMQKQIDAELPWGRGVVKEMTRMATYVGKHPAKLLIVEKSALGKQYKGHIIITYDDLTFYVLHSWCPTSEYAESQKDFLTFEKSFSVPDDINSVFTQAAQNEKKK